MNNVKIVYIAGKISGLEDLGKPEFERIEDKIIAKGYEAVNPHKIPGNYKLNKPWSYYMKNCIKRIVHCDKVIPLYNWEDSTGACLEILLCKVLDLQIIDEHFKPKEIKLSYIFFRLGINLFKNDKK